GTAMDQLVNSTPCTCQLDHGSLHLLVVGNIQLPRHQVGGLDVSANRICLALQSLPVDVPHRHPGAPGGKETGTGCSYARSGAGDEGSTILEIAFTHRFPPPVSERARRS